MISDDVPSGVLFLGKNPPNARRWVHENSHRNIRVRDMLQLPEGVKRNWYTCVPMKPPFW